MTDRELFIKALDALEWNLPVIQDYGDKEQLNIQHNAITALRDRLAQTEPVTGNILKDAYNAMVEKKTRSQKLREAGFTRRPKGWEKEKDEQEPVAFYVYKPTLPRGHLGNVSDGDLPWVYDQDPSSGYSARMLVYTTPPQRKPLTDEQKDAIVRQASENDWHDYELIMAVEAAHGIKS